MAYQPPLDGRYTVRSAFPSPSKSPGTCSRTVVAVTANAAPGLATSPTVTTTLPVVAPAGTRTTSAVADHIIGVPVVPLNLTVLVPWVAAKLVPAMVTIVPTGALVGS